MAKYTTADGLVEPIQDLETKWEGKSGMAVEDFLTRKLENLDGNNITEIVYENETLTVKKADGTTVETQVTVVPPQYNFGILTYGIRFDGSNTIYTASDAEVLFQYRSERKVEVGIALYATTTLSDKVTDRQGPFNVKIAYGSRSATFKVAPIKREYCILDPNTLAVTGFTVAPTEIAWIDVTELFNKSNSGAQITSTIISDDISETISSTLSSKVITEIISLSYNGDYIIDNPSVVFTLTGGNVNNYKLVGFDNGSRFEGVGGSMNYSISSGGVHKIAVRAQHISDSTVFTDPLYVDFIYTEGYEESAVVVNGISNGITNNDIATLYHLSVYSPKLDEVEITTYLDEEYPADETNPQPTEVMKHEIISGSTYKDGGKYTTSYQKYIEITSKNAVKFLFVKVNGTFYEFYDIRTFEAQEQEFKKFTEMGVEAVIEDFTYFKDVAPAYNFDQIGGYLNNVFVTSAYATGGNVANVSDNLEASDGWHESNGRTYFKVSAQETPVFINPINLGLSTSCTIELGFKTYNISDESKPILTIGNFQLRPTQFCWNTDDKALFNKRNSQFQENVETHIIMTIQKGFTISKEDIYYPDFLGGDYQTNFDGKASSLTMNLVRIFIDGVIDREIILTEDELNSLLSAKLQVNPTTADIDFYLLRIYNNYTLNLKQIQRNYISFLCSSDLTAGATKAAKQLFYDKNDILDENTGEISFEKCYGKLNTLVFVYPKGGKFPHRFWGGADGNAEEDVNKKLGTTLFVSYADPEINKQYGGRLTHGQVKGQGSSAMKYLIWNVNYSLNKIKYDAIDEETGEEVEKKVNSQFVAYNQMDEKTNKFIDGAAVTNKYYNMPPYADQKDASARTNKYKKMVGKVNFASSMQSHKIGACKLYNDAYYSSLGSLQSGGLKAVHEEPFMYFYWESDYTYDRTKSDDPEASSVAFINLQDLFDNNDKIKFMGFQTWGPGKGDDACSGYDEDATPEYIMLEGGENKDSSVNFRRPWLALQRGTSTYGSQTLETTPQISYAESLEHPDYNLYINDESIVYTISDAGVGVGAWDIDYGCEEVEAANGTSYFKFYDSTLPSLKAFRAFYDDVYNYNYDLIFTAETTPTNWNVARKYVVTNQSCSINTSDHVRGDIYRYDESTKTWVNAGVSYTNGRWDRVNVFELAGYSGTEARTKEALQEKFKEKVSQYIDIDDIAFHQAFIKFLSGTDNRAKNTYFQIIGKKYEDGVEVPHLNRLGEEISPYLIRLIGDDLDTIFVTDNNGLQTKPYNLLEASYKEADREFWGDEYNAFFYMFDQCYETEIISQLRKILQMTGVEMKDIGNSEHYLTKVFFDVQTGFPAVAYNHTAKIYYENAQAIKDSGVFSSYTNNNIQPIEQSHGSCLPCEKQFMAKRVGFLSGYAQAQLADGDLLLTVADTGGKGATGTFRLTYTPYQDFYPNYLWGPGNIVRFPVLDSTASYVATRQVAEAGKTYTSEIKESSNAINQGIYQVNLYKTLSLTGLKNTILSYNFDRMTEFEMDNNNMDSFFDADYPEMALGQISASFPVLEDLAMRNMSLPNQIDLTQYLKLKTIDFSNTTVKYVMFPETGRLTNITLPETLTQFRIYNNPGLLSVDFQGIENLETVYIDCNKCGAFDVTGFCEDLVNCNSLSSVTLRNANMYITEEALRKLIYSNECNLTGDIYIVETAGSKTTKVISFATKQLLVDTFGNIESASNPIRIHYKSAEVVDFTHVSEVSIYYAAGQSGTIEFPNAFGITIEEGNDVDIIEGTNPNHPNVNAYLDISYQLLNASGTSTFDTSVATINPLTGKITLKKESTLTALAKITIKTGKINNKPVTHSHTVPVSFQWKAPQLGDFVYADGSYTGAYDPNKTLMGLVYAIDATDSENGTAYVIGKEYASDAHYSGYNPKGANGDSENEIFATLYQISAYLSSIGLTNYNQVVGTTVQTLVDEISTLTYTATANTTFSGDVDTKIYVDHVNSKLLPILYNNSACKPYITRVTTTSPYTYYINSADNLKNLCDTIVNVWANAAGKDLMTCLLYPYFYSMYLYEPEVKEGETLADAFKSGKWYAPSAAEMSRIIYYRGYSAAGNNFNTSNMVTATISDSIANGGGVLTTPIFSLAHKSATNSFPLVWSNIADANANNVTTTVETNYHDNYSYQRPGTWGTNEVIYSNKWVYGDGNYTGDYYAQQAYYNAWRLTKHQGVPFVKFTYAKNG